MRKRRRGIEKETSRDRQKGEEKEKEEILCGSFQRIIPFQEEECGRD
jgi:hypothetical protein